MNLQNLIDYSKIYNEPDPLYGVELPAPLDSDKCKSAIMMRCGLLEPVYNDPRVFREMIYSWFHVRDWNFKHLIAIIQAEYSPIENTDRYSEHEITNTGNRSITNSGSDTVQLSGNDKSVLSGTDKLTLSGTDRHAITGTDTQTRTPDLTDTSTNEISAENASNYQPDNKNTLTRDGEEVTEFEHGRTDSTTYGKTDTTTYGKTDTTTYGKKDTTTYGHKVTEQNGGGETYTEHTHGNIGITSNVQLITEELELLQRFNVYSWIAERIEEEFFIMVY